MALGGDSGDFALIAWVCMDNGVYACIPCRSRRHGLSLCGL